jgi:hypothetical protein
MGLFFVSSLFLSTVAWTQQEQRIKSRPDLFWLAGIFQEEKLQEPALSPQESA